jgi:hypothetical protein
VDHFFDAASGLWLAADVDNAFPDVWGSLYLAALNLSTSERRAAAVLGLLGPNSSKVFRCVGDWPCLYG